MIKGIHELAVARQRLAGHTEALSDECGRLAVEVLRLQKLCNDSSDVLGSAWWELQVWKKNAERQREQLEHNHPACPTQGGIDDTQRVCDEIRETLKSLKGNQ